MDSNFVILFSTSILSTLAVVITILTLFMRLSDKIDNVKDDLNNFKQEVNNKFTAIETRLTNIETKLEISNERYNTIKEQSVTTNQRIDKLGAEQKNLIDKIFDFIKNIQKQPIL